MIDPAQATATVNEPRHLAVNERLVYDDEEGVSLWASEVMERSGAIGVAFQERVGGGRSNRLYIPAEYREQVAAALAAAPPPAPSDLELDLMADRLFYGIRDHLTIEMFQSITADDDERWQGPSYEAEEALKRIAAIAAGRSAGEGT